MAAFFVHPGHVDGDSLVLDGEEARHFHVRRYRRGDEVDAIDGRGWGYRIRIDTVDTGRVRGRILGRVAELGESPVRLHLVVAVVKGARFDVVVEKTTEVGVASITPALTHRGVVNPGGHRVERWRRLARSAAKQCGRCRVPMITEPMPILEVAQRLSTTCDVLLAAAPDVEGDLARLLDGDGMSGARPELALFVGPEGGFEAREWDALLRLGARGFRWGTRTLRVETAAVVLSALTLDRAERRLAGGAIAP